jgi:hypothetical protein
LESIEMVPRGHETLLYKGKQMNHGDDIRVSDFCTAHRENYPARPPVLSLMENQDELRQIDAKGGLFEFTFPPTTKIIFGEPPFSRADEHKNDSSKYLWVVASEGVPGALEYHLTAKTLKRGRLAHTNLTGGADAHTAGELWFRDSATVMINGGSSRYKPRGSKELQSVAEAFKSAGYKVANLGWDEETNREWRMQTENLRWL